MAIDQLVISHNNGSSPIKLAAMSHGTPDVHMLCAVGGCISFGNVAPNVSLQNHIGKNM